MARDALNSFHVSRLSSLDALYKTTIRRSLYLSMNSDERHEARYRRRKAKREARLAARNAGIGSLEEVFSFNNLFRSGLACCRGVRWKDSTRNFERHLLSGTAKRRKAVLAGDWKARGYFHFRLNERGKTREIDAPHITDRQIHKCYTQNVLVPLYTPSMIYDNGASQKGKGYHFTMRRVKAYLSWHFRHYGMTGGIFLADYKGYFPNAPRETICARHARYILDPRLRQMGDSIVRTPETAERGMQIGVEPSQAEMVALPSKIDNKLKCQYGIKGVKRYMDDSAVFDGDIERLRMVARVFISDSEHMGIAVNRDKCRVIPFGKHFRYCKAGYVVTETGRVIVRANRKAAPRAYKKLRALYGKYAAGVRTREDVDNFLQCEIAYFKNYDDHKKIYKLKGLYKKLFSGG